MESFLSVRKCWSKNIMLMRKTDTVITLLMQRRQIIWGTTTGGCQILHKVALKYKMANPCPQSGNVACISVWLRLAQSFSLSMNQLLQMKLRPVLQFLFRWTTWCPKSVWSTLHPPSHQSNLSDWQGAEGLGEGCPGNHWTVRRKNKQKEILCFRNK